VFVSNLAIVAGQGLRPETPSAQGTALPKPGLIARNRRARGRPRPYWLTSNLDEAEEWVRWRKAIQQKEMGRQIWEEGIWTMDRDQAMHGLVQDTHTHTLFSDIALTILRRMGYETGRRKLIRQGRWSDPYWARLGNPFLFLLPPSLYASFCSCFPFLDTIVGTCNERLLYDCIRDVSSID
jgi:hypothetical protein